MIRLPRGEKGFITIFLLITFLAMVILLGLFVDLTRIRVAENQVNRAANAAARSVIAEYDPELKNRYGLFVCAEPDATSVQYEKYLLVNLTSSPNQDFSLFDYRLEDSEADLIRPATDQKVFRQQVLEDMKYRGPIAITKDVIDKFTSVLEFFKFKEYADEQRAMAEAQEARDRAVKEFQETSKKIERQLEVAATFLKKIRELEDKIQNSENPDPKLVQELQETRKAYEACRRVIEVYEEDRKKNLEVIKQYEQRIKEYEKKTPPKLEGTEANKPEYISLSNYIDDFEDSINSISDFLKSDNIGDIDVDLNNEAIQDAWDTTQKRNTKALEDGKRDIEKESDAARKENRELYALVNDNQQSVGKGLSGLGKAMSTLNDVCTLVQKLADPAVALRDTILINEYAVQRFTNFTTDKETCEVERIIFGGDSKHAAVASAMEQVFLWRFAFDTLGYFIFDPKAPPELLSRVIYAVVMGSLQGVVDTYRLFSGKEVGIIEVVGWPPENLKKAIPKLNYKDYLRLMLLLDGISEDRKLTRMQNIVNARTGGGLSSGKGTAVSGSVTVSIRMWFLPLAGIRNLDPGPFGTRIIDGRCYITKNVEYGY